jgi:Hypothetical protein (DUF2513)
MRMNPDLLRKVVPLIEGNPGTGAPRIDIDGYTREEIGYHYWLLPDASFVIGSDLSRPAEDNGGWHREAKVWGLTYRGHEFAALARDEGLWQKSKVTVHRARRGKARAF